MSITRRILAFLRSESGAITVDWVVLTAAACFISVAIVASIQQAATDTATGVGADLLNEGSSALNSEQYP